MQRPFLFLGGLFGLLGVAAGAFGAHALRDQLDPSRSLAFETAVRYQLIHALALVAVALGSERWPSRAWRAAGSLFAAGVIVFCGSLYLLSLTGVGAFGAITPVGGACLLVGWALVAAGAWGSDRSDRSDF